MIKARIWILDDKDPEKDEVYENFDMLPTDKWVEGTFSLNELENYKFSFVFTKLKEKERSKYDISGSQSNNKTTI